MSIVSHQELEYHAQRYAIPLIIALSLLVFITPLVLRVAAGSPITPGGGSYSLLRDADLVLQGSMSDPLHPGAAVLTPYTALLAIMELFGVPWLLPPLLGAIFALLLYHFLYLLYRQRSIVAIGTLALVISPAMGWLSTWHTPLLLAMTLALVAVMSPRAAPFLLPLAVLSHPAGGLVLSLAAMAYLWYGKHRTVVAVCAATVVAAMLWLVYAGGIPVLGEFLLRDMSQRILFELGAPAGVSVFLIIIACYGIMADFAGRRLVHFSVLAGLVALAALLPSAMPLLTLFLTLLVGHAVHHLLVTEWRLMMLQESLLILALCIGLFLVITTVRERIADTPGAELSHALIQLRNADRPGTVLTAPTYAPVVEYYSGRGAALGPGDDPSVLLSRDAEHDYAELVVRGVGYVVITQEMRDSLFTSSDQGMLFLLQHSGRFVPTGTTGSTDVWYFIKMT